VYGIAFHPTEPALYASAYHKREKAFGPGGPGAIYRIDLATGAVDHWATVPNAGPDRHFFGRLRDRDAVLWVGKTSLGDLDISADGRELYVANPADRRIYRLAVDANAGVLVQPMPELADVAFGPSGEMVLGLRGRLLDTAVTQSSAGAPA
jgi:hypothetical protein